MEMIEPTTADVPMKPCLVSTRCIDPALPLAQPATLPYNSAIVQFRSPPLAK